MNSYLSIDEFLESLAGGGPKGQTPPESSFYEEAVRRFYATFDESWCVDSQKDEAATIAYAVWLEKQQQLVNSLRWLLSHDGRSFRALLWTAEWTTLHPDDWSGVNALAAVSGYLFHTCPAGYTDEQLAALFDRYCENKQLSVNAWQCLRAIADRRPDIKSKYPHNPPKRVLGIEE
jgi:hypothetical protein